MKCVWKLANMYEMFMEIDEMYEEKKYIYIYMEISEYVWNVNEHRCTCMKYVWKVVNTYEMLMTINEHVWNYMEICEYVWNANEIH